MAQDIILNSEPDKSMSAWDDMFVPIHLREYLKEIPAFDDQGTPLEFTNLLGPTEVIRQYPSPPVPPYNGYMILWLWCGLPLLLGAVLRRWPIGMRISGFGLFIYGFIFGGFGCFMALSWIFGSHTVLPHNANLWIFWPIDLMYCAVGAYYGWTSRTLNRKAWVDRVVTYVGVAHLLGLMIHVLASQWLIQDTSRVVIYVAPLCLLAMWFSTPTIPYSIRQFFKKNPVF